jgi:hypothetical protein
MRNVVRLFPALLWLSQATGEVVLEAPSSVACFDVAEFVLRVEQSPFRNPFTEAELTGEFTPPRGKAIPVFGFADSENGSVFRLRFSPEQGNIEYRYALRLRGAGLDRRFTGVLRSEPSTRPGPVIVDPANPKHFVFAASRQPFFHLGLTAYHLLDTSNSDSEIEATIEYCVRQGFNKIRFLLTGYPRDLDKRTSADVEHGVPDARKLPNYGSRPGQVNPLPAWVGQPHAYDFSRLHVPYWQRVDRVVSRMRERGIVATCIITIEKQDLPNEYGRLTAHELRLYRYAVARLAAFDNVWWDLGNEHNEFRDTEWGDAMGSFVKAIDPYDRLTSAHAYAEFAYAGSRWADFIVTQQYGDEKSVHDWALKFLPVPKPYVNEEYGYEGHLDKPGHLQNADWVRRCHWSIAMAGGYATYGDWSNGVSYFYMGEAGPGRAAGHLTHLRAFFEQVPFHEVQPRDALTNRGFALSKEPEHYVFYFPQGGNARLDLSSARNRRLTARWFNPRSGEWKQAQGMTAGANEVNTPDADDWVLYVQGNL